MVYIYILYMVYLPPQDLCVVIWPDHFGSQVGPNISTTTNFHFDPSTIFFDLFGGTGLTTILLEISRLCDHLGGLVTTGHWQDR